jgi:hypothetical protein
VEPQHVDWVDDDDDDEDNDDDVDNEDDDDDYDDDDDDNDNDNDNDNDDDGCAWSRAQNFYLLQSNTMQTLMIIQHAHVTQWQSAWQ